MAVGVGSGVAEEASLRLQEQLGRFFDRYYVHAAYLELWWCVLGRWYPGISVR